MAKPVHVVRHKDGWAVKREGADRASSVHRTKDEAFNQGRDTAKRERTELVIHGKDGRIQDKDSFGSDPFPPRDKKH